MYLNEPWPVMVYEVHMYHEIFRWFHGTYVIVALKKANKQVQGKILQSCKNQKVKKQKWLPR